jgi:hypothetical protein
MDDYQTRIDLAADYEREHAPPMLPPGVRVDQFTGRLCYPAIGQLLGVHDDTHVHVDEYAPLVFLDDGRPQGHIVRVRTYTIGEVSSALQRACGSRPGTEANDYEPSDAYPYAAVESWALAYWEFSADDDREWRRAHGTPNMRVDARTRFSNSPWPVDARIVVYAVRGGSEGYYVHVDALDSKDERIQAITCAQIVRSLLQIKCWTAADARAVVERIQDVLGLI